MFNSIHVHVLVTCQTIVAENAKKKNQKKNWLIYGDYVG